MGLSRKNLTAEEFDAVETAVYSLDPNTVKKGVLYRGQRRVRGFQTAKDGNGLHIHAQVKGDQFYEVNCHFKWPAANGKLKRWLKCTCQAGGNCKHVVAALLTVLEVSPRPDMVLPQPVSNPQGNPKPAPASVLIPSDPFANSVWKALGRPLAEHEQKFLMRFSNFWFENKHNAFFSLEILAKFSAPGETAPPIGSGTHENVLQDLWEEYPASPLGLWNCVAYALERHGFEIPAFMRPATDTSAVTRRVGELNRQREVNRWVSHFQWLGEQSSAN
ncbi:MAG: SWIM zinc finger family protein, partial [Kiritimatiellaeota bacterium]|nr:SWIM zinc finger family protein [Kiritimatiellota bacterium]